MQVMRPPITLLLILLTLATCHMKPDSAKTVASCAAMYAECVDVSVSMTEYVACRDAVDEVCLDDS